MMHRYKKYSSLILLSIFYITTTFTPYASAIEQARPQRMASTSELSSTQLETIYVQALYDVNRKNLETERHVLGTFNRDVQMTSGQASALRHVYRNVFRGVMLDHWSDIQDLWERGISIQNADFWNADGQITDALSRFFNHREIPVARYLLMMMFVVEMDNEIRGRLSELANDTSVENRITDDWGRSMTVAEFISKLPTTYREVQSFRPDAQAIVDELRGLQSTRELLAMAVPGLQQAVRQVSGGHYSETQNPTESAAERTVDALMSPWQPARAAMDWVRSDMNPAVASASKFNHAIDVMAAAVRGRTRTIEGLLTQFQTLSSETIGLSILSLKNVGAVIHVMTEQLGAGLQNQIAAYVLTQYESAQTEFENIQKTREEWRSICTALTSASMGLLIFGPEIAPFVAIFAGLMEMFSAGGQLMLSGMYLSRLINLNLLSGMGLSRLDAVRGDVVSASVMAAIAMVLLVAAVVGGVLLWKRWLKNRTPVKRVEASEAPMVKKETPPAPVETPPTEQVPPAPKESGGPKIAEPSTATRPPAPVVSAPSPVAPWKYRAEVRNGKLVTDGKPAEPGWHKFVRTKNGDFYFGNTKKDSGGRQVIMDHQSFVPKGVNFSREVESAGYVKIDENGDLVNVVIHSNGAQMSELMPFENMPHDKIYKTKYQPTVESLKDAGVDTSRLQPWDGSERGYKLVGDLTRGGAL